jgi:hypothetical protein
MGNPCGEFSIAKVLSLTKKGWSFVELGWVLCRALELITLGNLPIAVVQVVAKSAPFAGDTDVQLGVAYISYVRVLVPLLSSAT